MKYTAKEREIHTLLMKEILLKIASKNYPTYLKGGTALYLCHKLDRFSEDIDLNSEKKFNLESTIKEAAQRIGISVDRINITKDTGTTKRYMVYYNNTSLKVETSFRGKINPDDVGVFNSIRAYNVKSLIEMKIKLAAMIADKDNPNTRTKARDLHDIIFLAKQYPESFTRENKLVFINLSKDDERIFSFEKDYERDYILENSFNTDLDELERQADIFKKLLNRIELKSSLGNDSNSKTSYTPPKP